MDSGNPCLFGPSHWYIEQFASEDLAIIPGMGADAAGLAVLGKSIIPAHKTRFLVQTAPFFLLGHDNDDVQVLRDLEKHDASMVYYMALENPEPLFDGLKRVFPEDTPCAVVYWTGPRKPENSWPNDGGRVNRTWAPSLRMAQDRVVTNRAAHHRRLLSRCCQTAERGAWASA